MRSNHHLAPRPFRGLALLAALALWLPSPATGESKTADAIRASVEQIDAPPDVKQALASKIQRYLREREERVEKIADTLDPNTDKEVQDRWASAARETAEWAQDFFEDLEEDHEAHPSAVDTLTAAGISEHNHFLRIANSELPEKRDALWQRMGTLVAKSEELDRKWTELKRKDDAVDTKFRKAVADLQGVYTKVIEDDVRWRGKMTEDVRRAATMVPQAAKKIVEAGGTLVAGWVTKDAGLASLFGKIAGTIVDYNKMTFAQVDLAHQRVEVGKRLVQTERSILVTFSGTRDGVEDFLKEYNESKADRLFSEARSIVDDLDDDEADLAEAALAHVEKLHDAYQKAFENFATKHEYIFFGPLGTDALEALLEVRTNEAEIAGMRSLKLSDLLNRKYLTSSEAFDVPLRGWDEHALDAFEDLLRPEVAKTTQALVDLAKSRDTTVEKVLEYRAELLRDVVE